MNIEKLKQILIDNNIFVKDKPKNFLCKCPFCGDHKDSRKQGHLYVSKNEEIPVCHCWLCGKSVPIPKLIQDISGNKELSKEVITDEELKNCQNKQKKYATVKDRYSKLIVPKLETDSFVYKRRYVIERTNNQIELYDIPGLVLDIQGFLRINNLDIVGDISSGKIISPQELDLLQNNFIGFLGEHNTILYCRNIDKNAKFKFKKIILQKEALPFLEYYSIKVEDPTRNLVVLSEGNFNILGEHSTNSLNLRDRAKVYASGNTFSYGSLLKSVCYDHNLFKCDVVILGDDDKKEWAYTKFLKENSHIMNSCKVYINKAGKDFGVFPQTPVRLI